MARTKISEFSATANSNTDINSINIAEGCAPSNINDAIRELMAELKDFQAGTKGDSFNGPVGTTTAAAGAFTTLSSTGNTTLGDASGDTVTINGTATFANANPTLSAGTANGVLYLNGSKVATSGSALTFDGTNFGLGTASPNTWSTGDSRIATVQGTGDSAINIVTGSGNAGLIAFGSSTVKRSALLTDSSANMLFYLNTSNTGTSLSEQMRLTSTGLGIGTSSPLTKLDIKFATDKHALFLASSSYSNGADLVATNDGGSEIALGLGGNTVRFYTGATERMRLDSSGNLGLGVTPSASTAKTFEIGGLGNTITGFGTSVYFSENAYYNVGFKYAQSAIAAQYAMDSGQHRWYTAPSGTAGNAITFTQAMTLDANSKLTVAGQMSCGDNFTFAGADPAMVVSSGALRIFTGGSERARIDSSGNLLINTTTLPSSSGSGVQIYNNSGQAGRLNIGKNTSGLFNAIANYYSGTYVGGVNYDNTSTSFPTSSDIRLKKDIVDASSASAKIDQIRIVSHGWKHDDAIVEFGVIAQELVNVAPQAVSVGDAGEEIETTWGVDYSKLVPMLIKAHQEQQAIIEQLRARLDAANL